MKHGISLLCLLIYLLVPAPGTAQQPWVQPFTPLRELYISPTGTGSGGRSDPMSFSSAIQRGAATPGDLYWMLQGTYQADEFAIKSDGTAENPVVFRAIPGHRVTIDGRVTIYGAYTWLWGIEVTDPDGNGGGPTGVGLYRPGIRIINCVVHHIFSSNGIGAWNTGAGQVVYGNIIYENGGGTNHPHGIYTQNKFSDYGYKYFVNNMILDSADVCGNCFNVHAYGEGDTAFLTGFDFRKNIVRNGRFLIGGYNAPADKNIVRENYFYRSGPQLGYRRPTQVEVVDNFVVRGTIQTEWFWGLGEARYTQTRPNVYTGNQVYLSSTHVRFRTSAYLSDGQGGFIRSEGGPPIQSTDTFDRNIYSSPFRATFHANNNNAGEVDFTTWKSTTAAAGNAFDGNSQVVNPPTEPEVVILPNEYEEGRAHLAIYNFDTRQSVAVDLSSIVPRGSSYQIHDPKAVFGAAVTSGAYAGPINISTSGQEFMVFLLTWSVGDIPGAPQNLRVAKGS